MFCEDFEEGQGSVMHFKARYLRDEDTGEYTFCIYDARRDNVMFNCPVFFEHRFEMRQEVEQLFERMTEAYKLTSAFEIESTDDCEVEVRMLCKQVAFAFPLVRGVDGRIGFGLLDVRSQEMLIEPEKWFDDLEDAKEYVIRNERELVADLKAKHGFDGIFIPPVPQNFEEKRQEMLAKYESENNNEEDKAKGKVIKDTPKKGWGGDRRFYYDPDNNN